MVSTLGESAYTNKGFDSQHEPETGDSPKDETETAIKLDTVENQKLSNNNGHLEKVPIPKPSVSSGLVFISDGQDSKRSSWYIDEGIFSPNFKPTINSAQQSPSLDTSRHKEDGKKEINSDSDDSCLIEYKTLVWGVFIITTILCIIDGFVMGGDIVCGRSSKLPSKIWPPGASVGRVMANVVWRFTARLLIPAQNMMFFTSLWCFTNMLSEKLPGWISVEGIRRTHMSMHRFIGIYLVAVPSLAHVLVVFVPPLVDGTVLTYHPPSSFNYSQQFMNLNWSKFYDPAAVSGWKFNDERGVHLTSDELYRILLMVVLFCMMLPLDRTKFLNSRSYSLAITLHTISGIWYAVDNIRKISHTLAHFFNLPMLILWIVDRIISVVYYRKQYARIVHQINYENYVIVLVKLDHPVNNSVGDEYYLLNQVSRGPILQRSHPFTSFSNHGNGYFGNQNWDVGFIIQVMEEKPNVWSDPWTRWLRDYGQAYSNNNGAGAIHIWGPYRSACHHFTRTIRRETSRHEYVLIGTGSGFGYLLDAFSSLVFDSRNQATGLLGVLGLLGLGPLVDNISTGSEEDYRPLRVVYVTRSAAVFEFVAMEMSRLVGKMKSQHIEIDANVEIYLTAKAEKVDGHRLKEIAKVADQVSCIFHKRPNFEDVLSEANRQAKVFFIGDPGLGKSISTISRKKGLKFHADFIKYDEGADKTLLLRYFLRGVKVVAYVVVGCVLIHLVIFMNKFQK